MRVFKDGIQVSEFHGAANGEMATGTLSASSGAASKNGGYVDIVLDMVSSTACNPAEDICGPAPKD